MPVVTNWSDAIIGAVALAFGLAFGIGGQDSARRLLARGENTVSNTAAQVSAQQTVNNDVIRRPRQ